MKKLASIVLILALCLSALPALAATGDAILGRDESDYLYFNYSFPIGDTLYLSAGQTLYLYHVGDPDLTMRTINLPERTDGGYDELIPFTDGEALYALGLSITYMDDHNEFNGAKLYRLNEDGDAFTPEAIGDVDWSELVEYYDQDAYPTRPDCVLGAPGKAYVRAYDNSGDYGLYEIDLSTGAMRKMDELTEIYGVTPYRDGAILVEQYSYEQPTAVRLLAYDPADGSTQGLCEMEVEEYSPLNGLAYDAASDTVYCVKGGEICPVDLQAGKIGEGVTDMPLETYGNSTAFVMAGGYYVMCAEGACVRNLDPGQKADVRLKINDSGWNDTVNSAYFRFSNAHGDVSCVLSRDWNESQSLLESMMNRDDSIDVYVLSTSSPIFDALYKRGYLMEMDGSEKLSAFAETMYPGIRERLSTNGRLVALPVSFNCWTMGVNEKALERMGMTIDDVPDNWMDFLDFLVTLEEPLKANKLHLYYEGYTDEDARNDLFSSIFNDYQSYVNAVDPAMGYNTPLLRGLLEKLEKIDFVALGLTEANQEDDEEGRAVSYSDSDENSVLLQSGVGCTFGSFYSEYTPILMGLDADTPLPLILRADVAFINPFTKHPDVALQFIEQLADDMGDSTRYCLDPSLNEVIRGAQNEQSLIEAEKWLGDAKETLEGAEEADRQMLEENIAQAEENVKYWEEYGWEVSQRDLDWYRGHDDNITLAGVDWLYADDNGEAWELINQYHDHSIGLDEMLAGIDRKVQMMLMEGN